MFAALLGDEVIGMASIMKTDYYPVTDICPWISSMFVAEKYRGRGVCGLLIEAASEYAYSLGYTETYIPSERAGLYERYGYTYLKDIVNYAGGVDRLYVRRLVRAESSDPLRAAAELYGFDPARAAEVPAHEGGRNRVYIISNPGGERTALRISALGDRREEEYLAETEFVRYLAARGAPVADVLPSVNGRLAEKLSACGKPVYISLFACAPGMLISDNGYRYREGAPLREYFYNTGKTLGIIHRLSKTFIPCRRRPDYTDKYNEEYIGRLIPEEFAQLKRAIFRRLRVFEALDRRPEAYGLVHFDFSDGNYHIDMNTGKITVFDFDNCMYCQYMFDLANLWTHGVGWCEYMQDKAERRKFMDAYFAEILAGYASETPVPEDTRENLPLYIDMVLIENIVDEFECRAREGELPDIEDIEDEARCLIEDIPFADFC